MIRTVTPNPALDITYRVDRLERHREHRVLSVNERPGGKGLNVARVLAQLGVPVEVFGFLGERDGTLIEEALASDGVSAHWTRVSGPARRTVTIVDDGATLFAEPGPRVNPGYWDVLRADAIGGLGRGDVLVVSGSTPPGTPPGAVLELVTTARTRGIATVVDCSAQALIEAAIGGADILKPNARELAEATGVASMLDSIAILRGLGAKRVVVSRGADGLLSVDENGDVAVAPVARTLTGNATGAGDACVAALARGLADSLPWHTVLADALALSAAAVPVPVAGRVDLDEYTWQRNHAVVEGLETEVCHAVG